MESQLIKLLLDNGISFAITAIVIYFAWRFFNFKLEAMRKEFESELLPRRYKLKGSVAAVPAEGEVLYDVSLQLDEIIVDKNTSG